MDRLQSQKLLYNAHIQQFRSRLPQPGQLADLKLITLPVGKLSFNDYFLSQEYQITEPEGHEIKLTTPYVVEAPIV